MQFYTFLRIFPTKSNGMHAPRKKISVYFGDYMDTDFTLKKMVIESHREKGS